MIKRIFLDGLKISLPILITILIITWIGSFVESSMVKLIISSGFGAYYFPFLGWIVLFALFFLIGAITQIPLFKRAIHYLSSYLTSIPLLKSVFQMTEDTMGFLSKKNVEGAQVVSVSTPLGELIGIVTEQKPHKKIQEIPEEHAAVYFPFSYQLGGYTCYVPKENLTKLALTVEEGFTLAFTGGISKSRALKKVKNNGTKG